jgi:hypothetical protein
VESGFLKLPELKADKFLRYLLIRLYTPQCRDAGAHYVNILPVTPGMFVTLTPKARHWTLPELIEVSQGFPHFLQTNSQGNTLKNRDCLFTNSLQLTCHNYETVNRPNIN